MRAVTLLVGLLAVMAFAVAVTNAHPAIKPPPMPRCHPWFIPCKVYK